MFENYKRITATFPDRPEIERMIVMPLKAIYINRTAAQGANVIRLVQNRSELVPFVLIDRPHHRHL